MDLLALELHRRGVCSRICFLSAVLVTAGTASAQTLNVTYGSKGVQRIIANGVVLEDTNVYSGDAFHIWHMTGTDLNGHVIPGWGENNNGESWNAQTQTETYTYAWGSIQTRFVQAGASLNMIVTEQNNAGSGYVLDGAEIYPFALHFPADPAGFSGYSQFLTTTTGPGVSAADYGSGRVTSVIPDESLAMYGGWKNAGGSTYTPLMTTTSPDGLPTFLPSLNRPVMPGSTLTYTVSLRFTASGVAADASDAYASFAATYPSQMTWTDKRILGTAYLASSPGSNGDSTAPGGFPTNPRRYFNDASVDVITATGLAAFQTRMLAQAAANVTNAQAMNGQGVITWDLEGEQYPQATSYVCSPEQIATVAPEMESTVTNTSSGYFGWKLDDAYFKTMTAAGLKVGVCLRPQVFTLQGNGHATQVFLSTNAAIITNLENKARYANTRWGVTIFYVDSTVDASGGTLDPAIFQQLITDMPGFLFIPEESTPRYYAYSAPFYSFIFHTTVGTDASIYSVYPKAFGANLVNDVNAGTLAQYVPQLTQAVRNGDILMGHADYFQANDSTLVSIYQGAGVGGPAAPVKVTPAISWAAPSAVVYGTALSGTQLNASASTLGTFVYNPPAGAVLRAGSNTLMTTFTPSDGASYNTATSSVGLMVTQATPAVQWNVPAAIVTGTALSGAQLNATASVPGTFTYSPAPGTVPGVGTTTLQATFTPNDGTDYTTALATVPLTVTGVAVTAPAVTWGAPAAIVYGTTLSGTQLNATASVAGSYSYSPGAGSVLGAGGKVLTVVFTPADRVHYSTVTATVPLTVLKATPVLNWTAPGAIVAGTALSGAQLNATANVAGSFSYNPGMGSVPGAGVQTLSASFTPADNVDYLAGAASVQLTVNAAASPTPVPVPVSPVTKLAILSPGAGSAVSGQIVVVGQCLLQLDPAGSHLLVDGVAAPGHVTEGPYLFPLDTTTLSNGTHLLQLWAHDIGNNTTISAGVSITVGN